jgi:hypothetical protein
MTCARRPRHVASRKLQRDIAIHAMLQ